MHTKHTAYPDRHASGARASLRFQGDGQGGLEDVDRDLWAALIKATKKGTLVRRKVDLATALAYKAQGSAGVGIKASDDQGRGRR